MADQGQPDAAPRLDPLTFEEAFRRLGEMAESLEKGGLTLAEATARYEEGMSLVRLCNKLLDDTELKITTLTDAYTAAAADAPDAQEAV